MNNGHSHQSSVIICPGIHERQLTQDFLEGLHRAETSNLSSRWTEKVLIFPAQDYPAYSTIHILEFLQRHSGNMTQPIVFYQLQCWCCWCHWCSLGLAAVGRNSKGVFRF
jgi:hypothetical protein